MNIWAEELRAFLRDNERAIAAGELKPTLALTFRHVIGRQPAIPGVPPSGIVVPPAGTAPDATASA